MNGQKCIIQGHMGSTSYTSNMDEINCVECWNGPPKCRDAQVPGSRSPYPRNRVQDRRPHSWEAGLGSDFCWVSWTGKNGKSIDHIISCVRINIYVDTSWICLIIIYQERILNGGKPLWIKQPVELCVCVYVCTLCQIHKGWHSMEVILRNMSFNPLNYIVSGGPLNTCDGIKNRCSANDMEVSWNGGTPKSSIFMGLSIIDHPFCGTWRGFPS